MCNRRTFGLLLVVLVAQASWLSAEPVKLITLPPPNQQLITVPPPNQQLITVPPPNQTLISVPPKPQTLVTQPPKGKKPVVIHSKVKLSPRRPSKKKVAAPKISLNIAQMFKRINELELRVKKLEQRFALQVSLNKGLMKRCERLEKTSGLNGKHIQEAFKVLRGEIRDFWAPFPGNSYKVKYVDAFLGGKR